MTRVVKLRMYQFSSKLEDRQCEICPNSIEDELHCLVDCPRFINERGDLLHNRLAEHKNVSELIRFICTDDLQEQNKLLN